jgi:hypothetical protein
LTEKNNVAPASTQISKTIQPILNYFPFNSIFRTPLSLPLTGFFCLYALVLLLYTNP